MALYSLPHVLYPLIPEAQHVPFLFTTGITIPLMVRARPTIYPPHSSCILYVAPFLGGWLRVSFFLVSSSECSLNNCPRWNYNSKTRCLWNGNCMHGRASIMVSWNPGDEHPGFIPSDMRGRGREAKDKQRSTRDAGNRQAPPSPELTNSCITALTAFMCAVVFTFIWLADWNDAIIYSSLDAEEIGPAIYLMTPLPD